MYTETKKIHVFDYLSALIKETQYNRVTVSELIEGRIYTKKWGWIDFRLDDDHATEQGITALDTFANLIADLCWKRDSANKKKARSCFEVQACKGLWHLDTFVGHNGKRWNVQGRLLCWSVL